MWQFQIEGSIIQARWYYFALVILAGVLIRFLICGLREWERTLPRY